MKANDFNISTRGVVTLAALDYYMASESYQKSPTSFNQIQLAKCLENFYKVCTEALREIES